MIEDTRVKDQLYLAATIALLFLVSMIDGTAAVAIAVLLLVVGLVLYPKMRRKLVLTALLGAGVAAAVVLIRSL